MTRKIQHVLFVHPEGNSFNNPTIKALIDLFLEHDAEVSIMYRRALAPMPALNSVTFYPWGEAWDYIRYLVVNKFSSHFLSILLFYFDHYRLRGSYDLIVGVDREGLVQAYVLAALWRKPLVFMSFEIMFEKETSKFFKRLERIACRNVSRWFVQDEYRAALLANENGLLIENSVIVPVASRGLGTFAQSRLRDFLGIPTKKKVALMMGSLLEFSMIAEIISSSINWPDEWAIILHSRYGNTDRALKRLGINLASHENSKVFVSNQAVDQVDDMGYILGGINAGLAFYKPTFDNPWTGLNLSSLGLSSGKISTFLRYGIPIITNDIGIYSKLAQRFNFGLVVEHTASLPSRLSEFDFDTASESALNFFSTYLDFRLFEDLIWTSLETLISD
jgi:hypothetical protein